MLATSCQRLEALESCDGGRGKRGGVRVIYYYHNESLPLFFLNVFAKNAKANLTMAERGEMKSLLPRLVAGYRRRITK